MKTYAGWAKSKLPHRDTTEQRPLSDRGKVWWFAGAGVAMVLCALVPDDAPVAVWVAVGLITAMAMTLVRLSVYEYEQAKQRDAQRVREWEETTQRALEMEREAHETFKWKPSDVVD